MQNVIQDVVKELSLTCESEPLCKRGSHRAIPQRDEIIIIIKELRKIR